MSKNAASQFTQYTYNDQDKLVAVQEGADNLFYQYNVNGIRTQKTQNGSTTKYLVDENRDYAQVLVEENPLQRVVYSYGDDLISQNRNGALAFYHYDGLGSTRRLSNAAGVLTDAYDYEAFGTTLNKVGSTENAYLFTGEQLDGALNQYYLRARYYDQGSGRFTQMDSYQGNNSDPVSLHKYLYANVDPVNHTDPTGHFSLGEVGAADTIRETLSSIQTDIGFQIGNAASDPDSASFSGWNIILSTAGAPLKSLFRGILEEIRYGSSFVRYSLKYRPSKKEIDAAKFLAEKFGHRIYIRGSGVKGADFLVDGVKWELKTLNSGRANAVANNIKKSIERGNQGTRFIIDGRNVGLTHEEFKRGIENAIRDRKIPSEVKGILGNGQIVDWP